MSNVPILYSFRRCPYAMRARLALAFSGQSYLLREVNLKNKPEALLSTSPKGTVPVMVLPQGPILEESLEIVAWALKLNRDDGIKADPKHLISTLHQEFLLPLNHYKYPDRYGFDKGEPFRMACEPYVLKINQALEKNLCLYSDQPTYSDFAIFPLIRQFWLVDKIWFDKSPYNEVKRWLYWFMDHPLFHKIMVKYDPWTPEQGQGIFVEF